MLKLLQKSYHKKVKMIYIDPPYNTGNDFIYPDKFADNLDTYLRYTGQIDDEGFKVSTNAETGGRYHTNWLNMMYPRLKLARNLLRDDGAIFISIDDHEIAGTRNLCDEIFGAESFIVNIIWEKIQTRKNSAKYFSESHDYILCYAKAKELWNRNLIPREDESDYSNPDDDSRGPWKLDRVYANNPYAADYEIESPDGTRVKRPTGKYWRYSEESIKEFDRTGRLIWSAKGKYPHVKRFLSEVQDGLVPTSIFEREFAGDNGIASRELSSLLGADKVMSYPKPTTLLIRLLQIATNSNENDLVLDFFAGSCSTGHAVFKLNCQDGGNRRFINIQLPEPLEPDSDVAMAGFETISDIGRQRLTRAIEELSIEASEFEKLGFRFMKLDSSNIKPWDADFDNVEQALLDSVENIKNDRSEKDVLYELLLKYGLDLAVPIETKSVSGRSVYVIGGGALIVCLSDGIDAKLAEGIVLIRDEIQPEVTRVVFKDSGFKDDVAKTNVMQVLKQAGIDDVRSL